MGVRFDKLPPSGQRVLGQILDHKQRQAEFSDQPTRVAANEEVSDALEEAAPPATKPRPRNVEARTIQGIGVNDLIKPGAIPSNLMDEGMKEEEEEPEKEDKPEPEPEPEKEEEPEPEPEPEKEEEPEPEPEPEKEEEPEPEPEKEEEPEPEPEPEKEEEPEPEPEPEKEEEPEPEPEPEKEEEKEKEEKPEPEPEPEKEKEPEPEPEKEKEEKPEPSPPPVAKKDKKEKKPETEEERRERLARILFSASAETDAIEEGAKPLEDMAEDKPASKPTPPQPPPLQKQEEEKTSPVWLIVIILLGVAVAAYFMWPGAKKDPTPGQPGVAQPGQAPAVHPELKEDKPQVTPINIKVDSLPRGAKVRVNNTDTGKITPAELTELNPEMEYNLTFDMPGKALVTWRGRPSETEPVVVKLELPTTRFIKLDSEPPGANVYEGKILLGETPYKIDKLYKADSQSIFLFKLAGYEDSKHELTGEQEWHREGDDEEFVLVKATLSRGGEAAQPPPPAPAPAPAAKPEPTPAPPPPPKPEPVVTPPPKPRPVVAPKPRPRPVVAPKPRPRPVVAPRPRPVVAPKPVVAPQPKKPVVAPKPKPPVVKPVAKPKPKKEDEGMEMPDWAD